MKAREQRDRDHRRAIVKELRVSRGVERPYSLIREILAKDHGINVTTATISRDVAVIRHEYAAFRKDFDPLEKVGERAAKFRAIAERAMRKSTTAKEATDVARLLKVAIGAWNSEIALLQATGLLPNSLGVLKGEQRDEPEERITGEQIAKLFESVIINENELVSEAAKDWLYGQVPRVAERAALETPDGGHANGNNGNGSGSR